MLAEPYAVGVDWLTATTKSPQAAKLGYVEFMEWSNHMRALGHPEKVVKWQGYDGIAVAQVAFAERPDTWITRASGWQADIWYRVIMRENWKPTRMDIQVTGRFPHDVPDLAREESKNALEKRASRGGGRPYRIQLIEGFGTGDTLTIGSRASERYGRLYDKFRESKGEYPEGSWRWELETKGETAMELHRLLWPANDETPIVAGLIKGYFEDRGVSFPVNVVAQPAILHAGKLETSDEKSLAWLRQYVRPTVDRLKANGKENLAREALGLTNS